MPISDLITIAQTVLAMGAFILAYREFKQWRIELLGSKKIEAALKLGKLAREIKQAFTTARAPMGYIVKAPEYKSGSTKDEMAKQDREYSLRQRLHPLQEKLRQLNEFNWEISILFDPKDSIEEQITAYNAKFSELWLAIETTIDGERTIKETKTMYGDGNDEFSKGIEQITNELLIFARKQVT